MSEVILDRFWDKVEFTTDCWNWLGGKGLGGYGRFWLNKKMVSAHHFSYKQYKGKIPQGLVMDHSCKNPSCVNPDHLEAVTQRENVLRGTGLSAINSRKTHCIRGHEFNVQNTYIRENGMRNCRMCHLQRIKKYQEMNGRS